MKSTLQILVLLLFIFFIKNESRAGNTCNTATPIANNMGLFETHSNLGMTNSGALPPPCGNYVNNDFWFSTTVPATGFLSVVILPGTMIDPALAIYTGSCGNLNLEGCSSEDFCGNASSAIFESGGLIPGSTVYIRVWAVGGAPNGDFEIRVSSANPPPQIPLELDALVGTASANGSCVQLTTATNTQLGCAWKSTPEDMTKTFEKVVVLNFGTNNGGADGITIGFQNAPAGTNTCGIGGGGIGANGITNSFLVEFDTWDNGVAVNDIPQDHAAIFINGNIAAPINGPIALNGGNIEDGQDHVVRIRWNGITFDYEVYFDEVLVLSGNYDIVTNCLGGAPFAYWGATASTGGANNNQSICPYTPDPYFGGTEQIVDVTICEGQSYFAGGANQTTTGVYTDNTLLPNGCQSVTTTNLTVIPSATSTINETVCLGDCVTIGTQLFCNQGVHVATLPNQSAQGCDSIVTLNLNVLNPQAIIVQNPVPTIDCANPIITLDGSFSTTGNVSFQWTGPCIIGGANSPNPQVACGGTYTLVLTQIEGTTICTATNSVLVLENLTPPTANAGADQILDCTTGCAILDGSASSSGSSFIFSWTGPNNFSSNQQNPQVCNPGIYVLTVINSLSGCIANSSVNVTGGTAPTADAGNDVTIDCNNTSATLNGGNSSSGAGFTLVWQNTNGMQVGTGTTANVSTQGTYTLIVTDNSSGCSSTDDVVVSGNNNLPIADAGADQILDCINTSVTLDGSNSDSGNGFDLIWLDANGMQVGMGTMANVPTAGTYTLVVTNTSTGCSSSDDVEVFANNNLPIADAGNNATIDCNNTIANLDGSNSSSGNGFNLVWVDALGMQVGTGTMATVSNEGTYTLFVTNTSNGCFSTDVVTVTEDNDPPIADAGSDMTLTCNNTSTTLDGSNSSNGNGFNLVWQDANGMQVGTGNTANISNQGTYTLIVTNTTNSCSSTDEVIVNLDNTPPIADAGSNAIIDCNNTIANLDGSNSNNGNGFNLVWENAIGIQVGTGTMASVSDSGTYTLIVTNITNGCSSTDNVSIFENTNEPIADGGADQVIDCTNNTVDLDGSNSDTGNNFSLVWQDGNNTQVGTGAMASVSNTGTYTLIVTNNINGCSAMDEVVVTGSTTFPTADAGQADTLTCDIMEVTLNGSNSSSGSNFSYQWQNANMTNLGNDVFQNVTTPGTYTLIVTDDSNGCSETATVTIAENITPPIADAGLGGTLSCTASSITLDGGNSSLGNNFNYTWFNSNNTNVGTGIMINVSSSDTYTLVVTDNNNGCSASDDVEILQDNNVPTATATSDGDITCVNDMVTLDGAGSSTGANIQYEWFDDQNTFLGNDLSVNTSSSGTYTLVVTDGNSGCSSSINIVVNENMILPTVNIETPSMLTCTNDQVTLDGNNSSSGGNFEYEWFDATPTSIGMGAIVNVSASGFYTLVITDTQNGCTNSEMIEVMQDGDVPIANIETVTDILNCNTVNILLENTGSSSGNGINYQWQDVNGLLGSDANLEITEAGTYTLVVSNVNNGCSTETSINISQDNTPPTIVTNASTITCDEPLSILDGTGSSSGMEFTYEWQDILSTPISNDISTGVLSSGNYNFIVTNTTNGCTASEFVTVNENITNVIADAGMNATLTCGTTSVTLDGSNSTSNPNTTYQWLNSANVLLQNGLTYEANTADSFYLVVTDVSNGCADTSLVEVIQDANLPTPNILANEQLTCTNMEVLLDGSSSVGVGTLEFSWTDPNGIFISNENNIDATMIGNYTLQITDTSNGCSATTSFLVEENIDAPIADAGGNDTLSCNNNMASLNGTNSSLGNGINYQWLNPNGTAVGFAPILTTTQAGTYTLIVTNSTNGCSSSATTEVIQSAFQPNAMILPPDVITCDQDQVLLVGSTSSGNGSLSYQWRNSMGQLIGTMPNLNVSQAGTYILDVIDDSNGCIGSTSVLVESDLTVPTASTNTQGTINCWQNSFTVDATNSSMGSNFMYEWQDVNGSFLTNDFSYEATSAGVYNLMVTNISNGCTAQVSTEVVEDFATPNAIPATSGLLTCDINSVTLDGSSSLGTNGGDITYQWFDPLGNLLGQMSSVTISDTGLYQIIVTNVGNGCSDFAEISVEENVTPPIPSIEAITNLSLDCNQNSLVVDGSSSTPIGNLSYEWTLNNNIISTLSNPQIDEAGELFLTVTDLGNGCTATTSVNITENNESPNITFTNSETLTCSTTSIELDATNSSTGNEFEYLWTGGGTILNETTLTPTISQAGVFTLTITNTLNGCSTSETLTVNEDVTPPQVNISPADELDCTTTSLTLDASGSSIGNNFSYQWTTANGNISNNALTLNPTVNAAGVYTLEITNSDNGCTASENIIVNESNDIITSIDLVVNQPLCFDDGGSVFVEIVNGGTPPYLYSIDNQPLTSNNSFNFLESGNHVILVEDATGCQYSEEVNINVVAELTVDLPSIETIRLGENYELQPIINYPLSEIDTIIWTPADSLSCTDCPNPTANPINSTSYQVTVITLNGCIASATIQIFVEKPRRVYIPNAFSPNDDGINDIFYIFANENEVKRVNKFQVFTRWGELVFSAENFQPNLPKHGWDGYFIGKKINPSVLVYYAEIEFIDGVKEVFKGDVTLR